MFTERIGLVCLAALLLVAGNVSAISITTAAGNGADTYLANDGQSAAYGPNTTHGTERTIRAFRQLAATRSKAAYIRFDLGDAAGDMSGATLTFQLTYQKGSGVVQVYGLKDGDGDSWDEATTSYNTAPGMIPNPPTALGDYALDMSKVVLLGTITVPGTPAAYPLEFSSNPTNLPLTNFLNADTNKLVTFIFIGTGSNEGEVASKENGTVNPPTLTLPNAGLGPKTSATGPSPVDKATDVARDVVLSWAPSAFPSTHTVYFGTSFDDVNSGSAGVQVAQGLDANTYDPVGSLAFSQTYHWRVDEVNISPDKTLTKGAVWSFTTELSAYPITGITAQASSSDAGKGPENTINKSGLDSTGLLHSTIDTMMWVSSATGPQPTWIQYTFDRVYKLTDLWVWNYNNDFEQLLGIGIKNAKIEYSSDGSTWTTLGNFDFAQASGAAGYAHNTTVNFAGVAAKAVKVTVNSGFGTSGKYGLSEVRFFYIPVLPQSPQPASGATGIAPDVTLSWRAGREAASHNIYLGTDPNTLTLAGTATTNSFAPANLSLGTKYYWRVDEVNSAATPSTWSGDVWNFSTPDFLVVDDMESYNDSTNQIFNVWVDGYGTTTNGSVVGYGTSANGTFGETTIIHGGKQSMPFAYNNTGTFTGSEATRTFDTAQDWTVSGANTLSLWFRGIPVGFQELSSGQILMNGTGTDIYGTADQGRFVYKQLTGNGTIIARVDRLDNTNVWAKAGVMIRETLDAGSSWAYSLASTGNGVHFQARLTTGAGATSDTTLTLPASQTTAPIPMWVKLERIGNVFNAYYSTDGVTWTPNPWNPQTITMNANVYIGLAVTSHQAGAVTQAEFSSITTTGTVTGNWQSVDLGTVAQPAGNTLDALYVTVKDSTGKSATIKNTDDLAVAVGTWQQWKIPFSSLTGVSANKVKSMIIGIGDRTSPKHGKGLIYIDDVAFGRPAQ